MDRATLERDRAAWKARAEEAWRTGDTEEMEFALQRIREIDAEEQKLREAA